MDSLDIQKYINMAIKRKWWIILPFLITVLGGFTYLLITPRVYEAQSLLLVQQQKVPEDYVETTITTTVSDRIRTIEQKAKSRTNLEDIIKQYGLFESPGKDISPDVKVEKLGELITIATSQNAESRNSEINAFTISFRYNDPQKTMDVTNTLASYFTTEDLNIRAESASGTSEFLSNALQDAEASLKEKEAELKEYKERYMGGLPEQLTTNQSILERLQTSLGQLNTNLMDAENRKVELLKEIAASNAASPGQSAQAGGVDRLANDLASKKNELASLESRYTQSHPDVIRLKQAIAAMEKELAESQSQSGSTIDETSPNTALTSAEQALRRQLQELNIDIANYKANIDEVNVQIKGYQAKVFDTPTREQELLTLNRDYDSLKASYNALLDKYIKAKQAETMEKTQKGEQFKVIDYAKLPTTPVAPDIKKIILMTLALGLGLGCGMAYLMEMMDTSYKMPDDAEKEMQLPVLVSFPLILTEMEIRHNKMKNIFAYTGATVGFIFLVIGILFAVKGVAGSIDLVKGILKVTN